MQWIKIINNLEKEAVKAALKVADRGCVLAHGKISISGTPQELLDDPKVQEAYFGKVIWHWSIMGCRGQSPCT